MASKQELLTSLSRTQRESYKDIIDLTKDVATAKKLEYKKLIEFMQRRYNRLNAIDSKNDEVNEDLPDDYAIFQSITAAIGGRGADDLDQTNYTINGMLYGDIKKTSIRKRQIKDMDVKIKLLGDSISNLETIEADLTALKNQIDSSPDA